MPSGYPDYQAFEIPVLVPSGGTGHSSLTTNGVLLGAGTAPVTVTAAGAADEVLRVPGGGGAPAFGALDLSAAAALTGVLPVAHGGSGTATPALVAGTGIQITGSWPNQTVTNTSAYATLADPLPVAHGGWGTTYGGFTSPGNIYLTSTRDPGTIKLILPTSGYVHFYQNSPRVLIGTGLGSCHLFLDGAAGTSRRLIWQSAGEWRWQIAANLEAEAGANAGSNFDIDRYADDETPLGTALNIRRSDGLITLSTPLPVTSGGTGTATPALVAITGIQITGSWPNQTVTNTSPASALGDPVTVAHGGTGTATPSLVAGANIGITGSWPNQTVALNATINVTTVNASGSPAFAAGTAGTEKVAGLMIANASNQTGSAQRTQIGVYGAGSLWSIPATLLGVADEGLAWRLALDVVGNLAIENRFYAKTAFFDIPLCVDSGGTGTKTPALVAGNGITITGAWPAQVITNTWGATTVGNTATAGALLIGTGTSTAAWGTPTPDGCRVYHNADQSIPDGVNTALLFNSERYDNGGLHSTTSNTSRLTAVKAGVYLISAHVQWAATSTGSRALHIKLQNAYWIASTETPPSPGATIEQSISTVYYLAPGDYVEAVVWQASGSSVNITSLANYSPEFAMQWLSVVYGGGGDGGGLPENPLAIIHGGTGTATGSITGTGGLTFGAGGSNQNVTLTPSGSGYTILFGRVGIGTATPQGALSVEGTSPYGTLVVGQNSGAAARQLLIGYHIANNYAALQALEQTVGWTPLALQPLGGNVGIGTTAPNSVLHVVGLPVYANNTAALAGGLTAGAFYRTGADPDPVCVVH